MNQPDGSTGPAALLVSALGVSSNTYAAAVDDQQMADWLKVQMNALCSSASSDLPASFARIPRYGGQYSSPPHGYARRAASVFRAEY
jgi:hypothetical protein